MKQKNPNLEEHKEHVDGQSKMRLVFLLQRLEDPLRLCCFSVS
jgi:hypothetical protein